MSVVNVIVVDTSAWISYFRGTTHPDLELALKEGRVFLPPVVIAELLSARLKPSQKEALVSLLGELPMCDASFNHWVRVGELRARVASKGLNVSTPDTHVAQCCLDLDGYLLSEDSIFKKVARVSGLKLLSD